MTRGKFVVPALLALVFVIVLAGMASASVILTTYNRTVCESLEGYDLTFASCVKGDIVGGVITNRSWLVYGGVDAVAAVWDKSTGKLLATTSPGTGGINTVKMFSDGKLLVSPEVGTPYIFDAVTKEAEPISGIKEGDSITATNGKGDIAGSIGGKMAIRKSDGNVIELKPDEEDSTSHIAWIDAINENGEAVGTIRNSAEERGVLWSISGEIAKKLGVGDKPEAISNSGVITVSTWDGTHTGAGLWKDETFIPFTQGYYPGLWGVNDNGQIVGSTHLGLYGPPSAFVVQSDGSVSFLDPSIESDAFGIDNNGTAVGEIFHSDTNVNDAVIWTPVPEPSAVVSLFGMIGMGALAVKRRRRR